MSPASLWWARGSQLPQLPSWLASSAAWHSGSAALVAALGTALGVGGAETC